jgi:hypothetical protein
MNLLHLSPSTAYRHWPPESTACGALLFMPPPQVHSPVMPNHSVNLTRNSVPHLPGSARYAHNALPGKRVTLPRAGYLKR